VSDKDRIGRLLDEAWNVGKLDDAQSRAARKLYQYDREKYPSDGCAITLSVLLQDAGIDVPDIYTAIELGRELRDKRHWQLIEVGKQEAGDIGSTCGRTPHHGEDHIYLVLQKLNDNEMTVADNQSTKPHFRFANGQGRKTPTKFFLRAPGASFGPFVGPSRSLPATSPPAALNLKEGAPLVGSIKAIDTSAKTTGKGRQIKAKGYDAVGIYLRSDRCTTAMIADLKKAGLKIWSAYEKGYPDHTAYFTGEQGTTDGTNAAAFAVKMGQPTGTQIYATVDYDPDDSDPAGSTINGPISDYMTAFQAAIQAHGFSASVYGSGRTCRILIEKGLAHAGWLSLSRGFAEHEEFKLNASIVQISEIDSNWDSNTIADSTKPGLW